MSIIAPSLELRKRVVLCQIGDSRTLYGRVCPAGFVSESESGIDLERRGETMSFTTTCACFRPTLSIWGFWFDNPEDAAALPTRHFDPTKPTPFNGEHKAGPFAMLSVPDATTGLGPLCTEPNNSATPVTGTL